MVCCMPGYIYRLYSHKPRSTTTSLLVVTSSRSRPLLPTPRELVTSGMMFGVFDRKLVDLKKHDVHRWPYQIENWYAIVLPINVVRTS
jgi:hypothetical protein